MPSAQSVCSHATRRRARAPRLALLAAALPAGLACNGYRVLGLPGQGVAHVDHAVRAIEGLSVYGAVRHFGALFYDMANTLKLPDYTLANLGAGYRTRIGARAVTWRASIDNLTDRSYWITNSAGTPRTGAASVQFDL